MTKAYLVSMPNEVWIDFQWINTLGFYEYSIESKEGIWIEKLNANDNFYLLNTNESTITTKMKLIEKRDSSYLIKKSLETHPGVSIPIDKNDYRIIELNKLLVAVLLTTEEVDQIEMELINNLATKTCDTDEKSIINEKKIVNEMVSKIEKIKNFNLDDQIVKKHNRIFSGAPGTGKSYMLDKEANQFFSVDKFERITFYNKYTYQQFIGGYKPVSEKDQIAYRFVFGPFMRQLLKAFEEIINTEDKNNVSAIGLIIEELNRADAPSVFGDAFQLLDRSNGKSDYSIYISEEMNEAICRHFIPEWDLLTNNTQSMCKELWETLKLPANFYLWTTMNSADQGVFPLDTAFKRRWEYTYVSIDESESVIKNIFISFPNGSKTEWNTLRKRINDILRINCFMEEDTLIGPFFLDPQPFLKLKDDEEKLNEVFIDTFNDKVLMYLYEDVGKYYRNDIFSGCTEGSTLSKIQSEFQYKGSEIFGIIEE